MSTIHLNSRGTEDFSMQKLCLALLACLPLAALANEGSVSKVNGSVRVEAGQSAGDVSTVNGSVTIEEGATAADVETVNGSISIERNATVRSVESVNGGVSLAADAKAESVETVNGTLRLAEGVQVSGDVSAVNGSAQLAKGADIRGGLANVNGKMTITAAHVGGGLKTVNGDINVGADSRIEGGILVEKPNLNWFNRSRRLPRIVIGPGAVVEGKLRFEHEVELLVSDRAKIGSVEGAQAVTFSGNEP
jgi:formylmethanofuran dehydrogenase subunit C